MARKTRCELCGAFMDECDCKPTANRAPAGLDGKLRKAGFTIHSRPADGEPLWSLHGVVFTQTEALEVAQ